MITFAEFWEGRLLSKLWIEVLIFLFFLFLRDRYIQCCCNNETNVKSTVKLHNTEHCCSIFYYVNVTPRAGGAAGAVAVRLGLSRPVWDLSSTPGPPASSTALLAPSPSFSHWGREKHNKNNWEGLKGLSNRDCSPPRFSLRMFRKVWKVAIKFRAVSLFGFCLLCLHFAIFSFDIYVGIEVALLDGIDGKGTLKFFIYNPLYWT